MEVKIIITDKYLNDTYPRLFEVEKKDGSEIDTYNELLYSGGKFLIRNILTFIKHVLEGGHDYNESGFSFGPVTEGDIVWVDGNMVEFYVNDYKILYTKVEVLEFTLELAQKSIEAVDKLNLKAKGLVDEEWMQKIKDSIPVLEAKLKNIA